MTNCCISEFFSIIFPHTTSTFTTVYHRICCRNSSKSMAMFCLIASFILAFWQILTIPGALKRGNSLEIVEHNIESLSESKSVKLKKL